MSSQFQTVGYEELKDRVGGGSIAQVAVNLQNAGIRFLPGKGGRPWTTREALNAAMGLLPDGNISPVSSNQQKVEIL